MAMVSCTLSISGARAAGKETYLIGKRASSVTVDRTSGARAVKEASDMAAAEEEGLSKKEKKRKKKKDKQVKAQKKGTPTATLLKQFMHDHDLEIADVLQAASSLVGDG
mmetsp:Transcript_36525/g.122316  ORF Transcript_36525/g.122316 Transcript_36525/m.122316 type:complete len:109 (-) Transcript_36525:220-546(-)